MTKPNNSGSLSGNQVSTYHENRAERMPDTTFHTKGMLRKLLYFIWEEKLKAKRDYERVLEESLILRRQRTEDLIRLNKQSEEIQELYREINSHKNFSPLQIAG